MTSLLEVVAEFSLHTAVCNDVLYIPEADAFITAAEDHTVRLWLEDAGLWNSTDCQQLRLKPTSLAWDGCRQWVSYRGRGFQGKRDGVAALSGH